MKDVFKVVLTLTIGTIVLLPSVLIFNESDSILPNLFGGLYIIGLVLFGKYTKLGKWCVKQVNDANKYL